MNNTDFFLPAVIQTINTGNLLDDNTAEHCAAVLRDSSMELKDYIKYKYALMKLTINENVLKGH